MRTFYDECEAVYICYPYMEYDALPDEAKTTLLYFYMKLLPAKHCFDMLDLLERDFIDGVIQYIGDRYECMPVLDSIEIAARSMFEPAIRKQYNEYSATFAVIVRDDRE